MKLTNEPNWRLLLVALLLNSASGASDWVDPFNVDFVAEKRTPDADPFSNNLSNVRAPADGACSAPSTDAMLYYKRTINLLLGSVVLDEITGKYRGRLVIDLPADDFAVLREFTAGGGAAEPPTLQRIDEILTNTLEMTFVDRMELALMSWTDVWYSVLANKTAGFALVALTALLAVYRMCNAEFGRGEIAGYVALLCYAFDFCITWKRMLQEVEVNQYADGQQYSETPADCFPQKMNGWQMVVNFFRSTTDCRQYYKAMMYDVMWDVGPLDVVAHQTRVLVQILGNVGTAVSQMVSGLMGDFPFPLNIILLPLLMVFTLLLICIVFTYCTNTHVSVNFMHLFQFKLKKTPAVRSARYREEIQEVTPSRRIAEKPKRKSPSKRSPVGKEGEGKQLGAVSKEDEDRACIESSTVQNCDNKISDENSAGAISNVDCD